MFLGIDHLVVAVADPDDAAVTLEGELGLAASGGGRHGALGTLNRLVWFGDSFVELIGVFDRTLAERSWLGAPTVRMLDRGGGLATWAIATDTLQRDLIKLRAGRSDLGDSIEGERVRPDCTVVRWWVALPPRLGPEEPPFLIEHDATAAEWTPTDRIARLGEHHPLGGAVGLRGIELSVDDVDSSSERFGGTTGLRFEPSPAGNGFREASVGSQTIRLRTRRSERGVASIVLAAPVPAERVRDLFGCRWLVRPTS
jgi:hypothetical protein